MFILSQEGQKGAAGLFEGGSVLVIQRGVNRETFGPAGSLFAKCLAAPRKVIHSRLRGEMQALLATYE